MKVSFQEGSAEERPGGMRRMRPILLTGCTASGKSAVALELARQLGGEIVTVDSMQVYRGLDIGTAKPSPQERAEIRHHLLDVVSLDENFDAARFVELAWQAVRDIQGRGKIPILCGGTGLYFKAWLAGLGQSPKADAQLRAELEQIPLVELLNELKERDPATYAVIDRRNKRRIVRAVEVIRLTGRPFSAQRAVWGTERLVQYPFFGLLREPEDLRRRIDRRVDEMFANGLVEETMGLLKQGLERNRTAMQAIGYRQVVEYLRGLRSLEETTELVKVRTRQFAKRQMTWFRHQLPVEWMPVAAGATAAELAAAIARKHAEFESDLTGGRPAC